MGKSVIGNWLRKAGASVFFIGYLPASGTACSAVVTVLIWLLRERTGFFQLPEEPVYFWLGAIAVIGISFYLASGSKGLFGKDDSGRIVIDEMAGQLITFMFVPITIRTLLAGFFLFRFFDIVKPYPVYCMEELDEGVGVTMDDVAAGVCANLSLLAIMFAYNAIHARL